MRVALVLGTRPEIIKMSPVIRACEHQTFRKNLINNFFISNEIKTLTKNTFLQAKPWRQNGATDVDFFILHTGQLYSYTMEHIFFEQLELQDTKYNLDMSSESIATAERGVGCRTGGRRHEHGVSGRFGRC